MSESENIQDDGVLRKPSLIAGTTKKMALTYVGSTVCAAAIVIIDSLVAGVSIGPEALAAIAAAGPLLTVEEILHCLLGFGIDKLMIQSIGKGRREEANRIFGAILIAVLVVFLVVFALIIVFERPLLELFISDPPLTDMVIIYTVPLFAVAPFCEFFLCIERAFRIDGRAKLFSKRSVVTNIANILLDILLVSVFDLGLSGLAWASVISSLIGYIIPISHFFSKKRTVSPDFSVIFHLGELLSYVKQDIHLGSSATLDEVMSSIALFAQTAAIGAIGGSAGLAIWAVYKSLRGVILAVGNGVSASVSIHAGLLFGQKDYEGIRYSVKEGVQLALMITIGAALLVLIFADPLAVIYAIEPEFQTLCAECLRIGCLAFLPLVLLTVVTSYLPSVDKVKLTRVLVIVQYGLVIVAAILGDVLGLHAYFASYVGAVWAAGILLIVLSARNQLWFVPKSNPETIADYSIQLKPSQISAMSADVHDKLVGYAYPEPICYRGALVLEDAMSFIAQHNSSEEIIADIVMRRQEDGVSVTVIDNGMPYNPIAVPDGEGLTEPGALEAIIVLGFAADVSYDRVLDLNDLSLLVKPSAAVGASQGEEAEDGQRV